MEPNLAEQVWQVEVGGQVYCASFDELGEWVNDGSLHPEDKVRKGNLRWIEARKVPGLAPFFNAKAQGERMPLGVTTTIIDTGTSTSKVENIIGPENVRDTGPETVVVETIPAVVSDPQYCALHNDIESFFVCDTCCSGFCKACPRSYGGTVKICPMCGSMCKPIGETREAAQKLAAATAALDQGFGFSDFINALSHPFRFKTSLFVGALMFAFFSIGQSVTALGGIFMFASAIICVMFANMLTFGVLSNTVARFVQGDIDADFMPSFDDFSLLDDVVHPFFLSIGAYVVSFGPFFLTASLGMYLVVSSVSSQMQTFQSEIERLPGTQYYTGREPFEQSQQVRRVLGDVSEKHEELIDQHNEAATGDTNVASAAPVDEDLELWNQLQESRKRELEAAFGKTQETREKEFDSMIIGILKLAAPLVIVGGLAFLWGLFFFPAACAVAGYSRSFTATINPLVGLDTIRRLGLSYVKILLMGLLLIFISMFVGGILGLILSPFDLPGMGNIPAKFFSSFVTFYVSVVFSCIVGYALFKNAHNLGLAR